MRIFSGIQPTGELHIGNYFGAIERWVELQQGNECIYCIADYHALTNEDTVPAELRTARRELALDLVACGIDPERSVLYVQSAVPEHTELCWILGCVASYGDLTRMTQFKEKAAEQEFINGGLFYYPVLQAADILLYRADHVPVGEDQVQHLEEARRIARRFNFRFGGTFPEPEPILGEGARIMSLADPERKMSKSAGPDHYIGLMEPEESIRKKVRSAVTDVGLTPGQGMSPGVANLFSLHADGTTRNADAITNSPRGPVREPPCDRGAFRVRWGPRGLPVPPAEGDVPVVGRDLDPRRGPLSQGTASRGPFVVGLHHQRKVAVEVPRARLRLHHASAAAGKTDRDVARVRIHPPPCPVGHGRGEADVPRVHAQFQLRAEIGQRHVPRVDHRSDRSPDVAQIEVTAVYVEPCSPAELTSFRIPAVHLHLEVALDPRHLDIARTELRHDRPP
nr:tryptophan--tRNA ligase [Candidatus Bipolaricaulis anaerobius]